MTNLKNGNAGLTRSIVCFVLIAFTAGCTTMRPVYGTDAASYAAQIEVGDKIEITRKDLTTIQFKVTDVSNDGISGEDTFVAYSDVETIQMVHNNAGKVTGIVLIGVALVGLAGMYAMAEGGIPGIGY
jgi:hypothetical protein